MNILRSLIFFSVTITEAVLYRYVISLSGLNNIYIPLIFQAIIFSDAIVFYLLFSSIIMSLLLIGTLQLIWSLFGMNFLNFSSLISYMFGLLFSLFFILLFRSRSFSDSFIQELKNVKVMRNRNEYYIKFLSFLLSLPYLLLLRNYLAFIGSIFAGIFILLFASVYEIPLVLASWIALPFIYEIGTTAGTEIETSGSICIGKVEAVLERSPTQALSRIPLRSLKYSWRQKSYNYCINFETLKNYNVAIVGTSGSGKSHLAKLIVNKLNTSFLVFDPHGEYDISSAIKIDASKIKINPLSLLGESPRQRALEVAYMIKSVFNLGNIQTFEFYNLLLDAYTLKGIFDSDEETWKYDPPTFYDVYSILQKRKSSALSSNELNKYLSLEPYVSFLANEVFASNSINMEDLIDKNVIIDLSKVPTSEIRYIMIETILRGIYSYLYSKGQSKLWKIVIIDESPFVLSKDTGKDIVVKLAAEGRKFGLGIMLISQSSKLLKEILPNISLFYAFATVEPSELEYTSKFLSGSDEEEYKAIYETLQKLDRGVMITKDIYKNSVILVRVSDN